MYCIYRYSLLAYTKYKVTTQKRGILVEKMWNQCEYRRNLYGCEFNFCAIARCGTENIEWGKGVVLTFQHVFKKMCNDNKRHILGVLGLCS